MFDVDVGVQFDDVSRSELSLGFWSRHQASSVFRVVKSVVDAFTGLLIKSEALRRKIAHITNQKHGVVASREHR